jgi:hypothetical protein
MNEAKPFCISKKEVWEAYKRVKANKGAAGVDDQSIEDFGNTPARTCTYRSRLDVAVVRSFLRVRGFHLSCARI